MVHKLLHISLSAPMFKKSLLVIFILIIVSFVFLLIINPSEQFKISKTNGLIEDGNGRPIQVIPITVRYSCDGNLTNDGRTETTNSGTDGRFEFAPSLVTTKLFNIPLHNGGFRLTQCTKWFMVPQRYIDQAQGKELSFDSVQLSDIGRADRNIENVHLILK